MNNCVFTFLLLLPSPSLLLLLLPYFGRGSSVLRPVQINDHSFKYPRIIIFFKKNYKISPLSWSIPALSCGAPSPRPRGGGERGSRPTKTPTVEKTSFLHKNNL